MDHFLYAYSVLSGDIRPAIRQSTDLVQIWRRNRKTKGGHMLHPSTL